ncbi:MAG: NAD(P)H-dependent oxidoreductase [Pseudomonadales bacterium]|nr:NAD(P)H-dependent oxidoreductase [Pseudomonadales bacterium]
MKKALVIKCSPREENSSSTQLSEHFVKNLKKNHSDLSIDEIDLWKEPLPAMNGHLLSAKYAFFENQSLNEEQQKAWGKVEHYVQQFSQADIVIIASPIWNFSIPYVLKHYIDVITQPGLCFSWSPEEGYKSLLSCKPAVVISSSASDYRKGAGNEADDFGIGYLQRWLEVYMGCEVTNLSLSPTVDDFESIEITRRLAYYDASMVAQTIDSVLIHEDA